MDAACPWSNLAPSAMSFCERRLCAWAVEPANTWSNIGYLAVGLWLLWRERRLLTGLGAAPGLTSVLVGLGSAFFHGTGSRIGEIIDVSAMYLISSMFVAVNLRRLNAWSDARTWLCYALVACASIGLLVFTGSHGIGMFAAHLVIAGLAEIRLIRRHRPPPGAYRPIMAMGVAFAAALTAWGLDISGLVCDPDNHVFGGHAFWHLSNSTCLYFYWRFLKSPVAHTAVNSSS